MRYTKIIFSLFFLLICRTNVALAQKKNIDSNTYARWSSVDGTSINSNGKYASYSIENLPLGSRTLVVLSTENNWKRSFIGTAGQSFLNAKGQDYSIFLNQKDSLIIVSLGKDLVQYIPNISSFSLCRNGESEWIAYQPKQQQKELILQNLNTGKKYAYTDVVNSVIGGDGQTVILQTERKNNDGILQELNWINLGTGKRILIWKGLKAGGITLDLKHYQLAFISENGLFSYNMTTHKLNCLMNTQTTRLDSGLKLDRINRFSHDGERLFVELKEEDKPKPKPGVVEIWSYLDHKIQTQQRIEERTYAAVVNLIDRKIIRLEREFEHLAFNSFADGSSDTIRLITRDARDNGDWYNVNSYSHYLISLKDGKRIPLKYPPEGLSPSGKYLVYLDPAQHTFMSYNTKTGARHSIAKACSENPVEQNFVRLGCGIAGWLENDEGVLFYDNYDIWRIDLSGMNAPVNLTEGYGKANDLVFSIVYGQSYSYPLQRTQKIILSAFNLKSKQNGFYSLEVDKVKKPELLSMGNYFYGAPSVVTIDGQGMPPIKAKKAAVYLVSRSSAKEVRNYFCTRDFKTFKSLSNVHPERDYNWYTTELHTWTSLDGKSLQGVLYKPENFDPTKKYPVIFHYYESKSNDLNAYIKPEALCAGCNIDIPTYVSNGYLVFTPDIVYKIGDPMQGTYDAVVSAAKYIGNLPFVESKKMGIQGCSWGGIQTNYLVTHTNLFAAACSASGIADWIANYGRLRPDGSAILGMYEVGQNRMGKSIWEIPDAYIKTSPIFQLDKVTTPFLIMHTKKDSGCLFEDALELFTGLRRLGKKSWMLAYPDEDHGISDKKRASDFSTRMMQFFDHYLKDKPAPIWMTTAIPAEKQELEDGLAYDAKIKTPGPGLLNTDEQRKVDSIMTRKPLTITFR